MPILVSEEVAKGLKIHFYSKTPFSIISTEPLDYNGPITDLNILRKNSLSNGFEATVVAFAVQARALVTTPCLQKSFLSAACEWALSHAYRIDAEGPK